MEQAGGTSLPGVASKAKPDQDESALQEEPLQIPSRADGSDAQKKPKRKLFPVIVILTILGFLLALLPKLTDPAKKPVEQPKPEPIPGEEAPVSSGEELEPGQPEYGPSKGRPSGERPVLPTGDEDKESPKRRTPTPLPDFQPPDTPPIPPPRLHTKREDTPSPGDESPSEGGPVPHGVKPPPRGKFPPIIIPLPTDDGEEPPSPPERPIPAERKKRPSVGGAGPLSPGHPTGEQAPEQTPTPSPWGEEEELYPPGTGPAGPEPPALPTLPPAGPTGFEEQPLQPGDEGFGPEDQGGYDAWEDEEGYGDEGGVETPPTAPATEPEDQHLPQFPGASGYGSAGEEGEMSEEEGEQTPSPAPATEPQDQYPPQFPGASGAESADEEDEEGSGDEEGVQTPPTAPETEPQDQYPPQFPGASGAESADEEGEQEIGEEDVQTPPTAPTIKEPEFGPGEGKPSAAEGEGGKPESTETAPRKPDAQTSGEGDPEKPEEKPPSKAPDEEDEFELPDRYGEPVEPWSREEALQTPFILQLGGERFGNMGKVPTEEFQKVLKLSEGDPSDEVPTDVGPILKDSLRAILPGNSADLPSLEHYCERLQSHVSTRSSKGMQVPTTVLSPRAAGRAWTDWENGRKPNLFSSQIKRCNDAKRVVLLLPSSHGRGDPDIIVGVIDRRFGSVRVIDSSRHSRDYGSIVDFLKALAEKIDDRTGAPHREYLVPPQVPEVGFPVELETREDDLPAELRHASVGMALETLTAIAEDRAPTHRHRDVPFIRERVCVETVYGLKPRLLENGEMRPVEKGD